MYLQILKKDLKRKKTMNLILFIFIVLAATFIAGSANNMVTVINALDVFFEKAQVPDHMVSFVDAQEAEKLETFAKQEGYTIRLQEVLQIDPQKVEKENGEVTYNNTMVIARLGDTIRIFDSQDQEVTHVKDGEIYFALKVLESEQLQIDDQIQITANGRHGSYTIAGGVRDALFASEMAGMTRIFVSDHDYSYFDTDDAEHLYLTCIYTKDKDFSEKLNKLGLNLVMDVGRDEMRLLYMIDMVIAAVMIVVSICLILISLVILRFTILFTMSEEFREIGVMKAIGIANHKIRGLYVVKYFTISLAGGLVGLLLSIPFGRMMLGNLSQNLMMETDGNLIWNVLCAAAVAVVVVLSGYSCTRKIKGFSPMDAIRGGENGERYGKKSVLSLHRSRLSAVVFLSLNDILSEIRRCVVLVLIFTIGILLVIIPINAINTLQSDHLLGWFSMAPCEHVISKEQLFHSDLDNRLQIQEQLDKIRGTLSDHGIKAQVYEEVLFRMSISFGEKQESSLAFQGIGDITADRYMYLEGSAPQDAEEIGISHLIADRLGAQIGDTVQIKYGDTKRSYLVTAIFQTMNNMGEGIRFSEKDELDYRLVFGSFGIQIRYMDEPDKKQLEHRKEQLAEWFTDYEIYTAGEYINEMIGDLSGQLKDMKYLILIVVLCINILVTVLMVKSFLTKERGEIAMLKAIGFADVSLAVWQTLRIGIILLAASVIGTVLSTPISNICVTPVFQMMGAQSISFDVRPLEVYVMYPLAVFLVTVLAGMCAAMQVKKIPASEASNIE